MAGVDSSFVGITAQEENKQVVLNVNSVEKDTWMVPLQISGAIIPLNWTQEPKRT